MDFDPTFGYNIHDVRLGKEHAGGWHFSANRRFDFEYMKLFQKDKSFYKKVLILALPIALQSLIAVGVNMLDTIMVGSIGSSGGVEDGETMKSMSQRFAVKMSRLYKYNNMRPGTEPEPGDVINLRKEKK